MKAFVVIFTICMVVGALAETYEEKKAKIGQIKEHCKRENGIDDAIVQKIKSGEQEYFDRNLKCYSSCFFKSMGIMNADGTINDEVGRSRIFALVKSAEKTDEILNKCRVPDEKDECELAGKVMHCLVQNKVVPLFE